MAMRALMSMALSHHPLIFGDHCNPKRPANPCDPTNRFPPFLQPDVPHWAITAHAHFGSQCKHLQKAFRYALRRLDGQRNINLTHAVQAFCGPRVGVQVGFDTDSLWSLSSGHFIYDDDAVPLDASQLLHGAAPKT